MSGVILDWSLSTIACNSSLFVQPFPILLGVAATGGRTGGNGCGVGVPLPAGGVAIGVVGV